MPFKLSKVDNTINDVQLKVKCLVGILPSNLQHPGVFQCYSETRCTYVRTFVHTYTVYTVRTVCIYILYVSLCCNVNLLRSTQTYKRIQTAAEHHCGPKVFSVFESPHHMYCALLLCSNLRSLHSLLPTPTKSGVERSPSQH